MGIWVAAIYFFLYEIPESSLFNFPVIMDFISFTFDFVDKPLVAWTVGVALEIALCSLGLMYSIGIAKYAVMYL